MGERRGLHRDPKGGGEGRGLGEVVLGDEGYRHLGHRRGRMEKEKERRGGEETRRRGKEERMRGWGGGAVFLAMQVLEIPAGGRGFPLVTNNL